MAKPNPNKVNPVWARGAIATAMLKNGKRAISTCYSEYVMASYKNTGRLASGCDAKDLIEWYKENMPDEYKLAGGK